LVCRNVLFQLIFDVLCNRLFIPPNCIYVLPSAPEVTIPVFVFQIGVSVEYHQTAFPFEIPHELRYTQTGWNAHQHMDMIRARLCFYDFHTFLLT